MEGRVSRNRRKSAGQAASGALSIAEARVVATMSDPTNTLILGAAMGYSPSQASPFLRSLPSAHYHGAIALLVEGSQLSTFRGDRLFDGVILLPGTQWPARRHRVL